MVQNEEQTVADFIERPIGAHLSRIEALSKAISEFPMPGTSDPQTPPMPLGFALGDALIAELASHLFASGALVEQVALDEGQPLDLDAIDGEFAQRLGDIAIGAQVLGVDDPVLDVVEPTIHALVARVRYLESIVTPKPMSAEAAMVYEYMFGTSRNTAEESND